MNDCANVDVAQALRPFVKADEDSDDEESDSSDDDTDTADTDDDELFRKNYIERGTYSIKVTYDTCQI